MILAVLLAATAPASLQARATPEVSRIEAQAATASDPAAGGFGSWQAISD